MKVGDLKEQDIRMMWQSQKPRNKSLVERMRNAALRQMAGNEMGEQAC
jgi:hypothetical protein